MKKMKLIAGMLLTVLLCSFAPADWLVIESREAGFRMSFPRRPVGTEQEMQSANGPHTIKTFMHEVGKFKDDNTFYGIICSDYADTLINSDFKDAIIDEFFKNEIKRTVSQMNGTKISEIKINYKDYPGRRIKVKYMDDKAIMYMQIYLIKSRTYALKVACEAPNDNNPSIDKFLTSFAAIDDVRN